MKPQEFAAEVERILDHFLGLKNAYARGTPGVSLRDFDGFEIVAAEHRFQDSEFLIPGYLDPVDLPLGWRSAMWAPHKENLIALRHADIVECRGRVSNLTGYLAALSVVFLNGQGIEAASKYIMRWLGNRRWEYAYPHWDHRLAGWIYDDGRRPVSQVMSRTDYENIGGTCQIGLGMAMRREFSWGVKIAVPGRPGLFVPTNAEGVEAFIAARDKHGTTEHICHWVEQHWRTLTRSDPDTETKVRAHLRGKRRFMFGRFQCEMLPSPFSLNVIQEEKLQRELEGISARRPKRGQAERDLERERRRQMRPIEARLAFLRATLKEREEEEREEPIAPLPTPIEVRPQPPPQRITWWQRVRNVFSHPKEMSHV